MEKVEVLKALADETRLRMLNIIKDRELCVCDIENALNLSQSNASKHLNKLKSSKIIKAEKKAQWVYYSLNQKTLEEYSFINELIKKGKVEDILEEDIKNLKKYLETKEGCEL